MKNFKSRYFEDYKIGEKIDHSVPRTITEGDVSIYLATTGSRFPLNYSNNFAKGLGLINTPIDDILLFHMVFGRTVPDLSLNAIANLGYAGVKFHQPVFAGDTVCASSKIIGLKENSNGKTGTVYVESIGKNQKGEIILSYYRWLMMRKKNEGMISSFKNVVPDLPKKVKTKDFVIPKNLKIENWSSQISGSPYYFDDYSVEEEINHLDGQTIEEAEHQLATRLYQNNARVHFNNHIEKDGRFGKRIIYGGYIISLARAISCNGLANGFKISAIHSGKHSSPTFSGDTIYAWSKILEKEKINNNLGTLLIRTLASKNNSEMQFPEKKDLPENIVLDIEYSILIPIKQK
ncbi:MAG: MaoC family dehydratase [Pseudomonadota bacterium]|nr:MaoC family dehydratase [Pseudomonadota bacterium]